MGYFSNGTEGEMYFEQWCSRCVHRDGPAGDSGCAVWLAHLMSNYSECNKKDSILHVLIPRDGINNGQCAMFFEGDSPASKRRCETHEAWLQREGLLG